MTLIIASGECLRPRLTPCRCLLVLPKEETPTFAFGSFCFLLVFSCSKFKMTRLCAPGSRKREMWHMQPNALTLAHTSYSTEKCGERGCLRCVYVSFSDVCVQERVYGLWLRARRQTSREIRCARDIKNDFNVVMRTQYEHSRERAEKVFRPHQKQKRSSNAKNI